SRGNRRRDDCKHSSSTAGKRDFSPAMDSYQGTASAVRFAGLPFYYNALNPEHASGAGGLILPPTFKSTRITFFSVEQNNRFPVRSNTTGAAATKYPVFNPSPGLFPTAMKLYPDFVPPARL